MTKSAEIARELESFYRHYVDVFNREDDGFFVSYAPIFPNRQQRWRPSICHQRRALLNGFHEGAQTAGMGAVGSRSHQGLGSYRRSRNDRSRHNPLQG
jgi:hypothetical protein